MVAITGLWNRNTVCMILVQFVSECSDGNSQNIRSMGTVAKAMLQGIDDEISFNFSDSFANQEPKILH